MSIATENRIKELEKLVALQRLAIDQLTARIEALEARRKTLTVPK